MQQWNEFDMIESLLNDVESDIPNALFIYQAIAIVSL